MKSCLRKINFALGRDPKVENIGSEDDKRKFIPMPFKAVLLIGGDFELAWGWRYRKDSSNPTMEAENRARRARINIPRILNLCCRFEIPITWATVGHLFLDKCSKKGHLVHSQLSRIPYHENKYWRYDRGDWFDGDPCTDWIKSPEWYAPDIIEMILDSKVKHEIACHTFSHINCDDSVCAPNIFEEEIHESQKGADSYGIKLQSFVHPGHIIGNLSSLRALGFTSFRTDYANLLDYPQRHRNGLWEIKSTSELVFRKEWSFEYQVYRYKKIIERALKFQRVCCYWFHPSAQPRFVGCLPVAWFR